LCRRKSSPCSLGHKGTRDFGKCGEANKKKRKGKKNEQEEKEPTYRGEKEKNVPFQKISAKRGNGVILQHSKESIEKGDVGGFRGARGKPMEPKRAFVSTGKSYLPPGSTLW